MNQHNPSKSPWNATPQQLQLRERALQLGRLCAEKIRERNLPMKVDDSELVEDGKKIIFTFYAEERIDFRTLVRDLAAATHLRVEMRQIGARDHTKHRGCLGACGQVTTCCSTFLKEFQPISMGMAKTQGLAPNPAKLAGMCGKLKCCLAYENEQYLHARKGLFKMNSTIMTPKGIGRILGIDILSRSYTVALDGSQQSEKFPSDACRQVTAEEKIQRDAQLAERQEQQRQFQERKRDINERRQHRRASIAAATEKAAASPDAVKTIVTPAPRAATSTSSAASPPQSQRNSGDRNRRRRRGGRNRGHNRSKGSPQSGPQSTT